MASYRPFARWRGLALEDVTLTDGFWAARQKTNHQVSLGHGFQMLTQAGNFNNLRLAGGESVGSYQGPVFMDSDVYKWLEAVAYAATAGLSRELQDQAEQAIRLVQAAQAADGYLDSYYEVVARELKWQELNTGHELYCAGHFIQAAVAWQRHGGDGRLLTVAQRLVDHMLTIFGPDKRVGVPGHPEIELALVELYRLTRDARYLDLARFFVDHRGHGLLGPHPRFGGSAYYQDRVPVRESSEVEGHAVRALYLTSGVTDVYLETGERALLDALLRQWTDLVAHKLYITGGAGSRHNGEAFGHAYELPTERAYCETCAAIASIMWSWRLLLATGEARFADLIERTLFNGFLSGVSAAGDRFFYVNPLMSSGESEIVGRGVIQRQPWFLVACCPPNVMRVLASLGAYLATSSDDGVQIHEYIPASVRAPSGVQLRLTTEYPWHGDVRIFVEQSPPDEWTLELRIPYWAEDVHLRVNDADVPLSHSTGYVSIRRAWRSGDRVDLSLPVVPRITEPHPRIDSTRGCVAIERGPLVYCIEQADHTSFDSVLDMHLDPHVALEEIWRPDLLGGLMTVAAAGQTIEDGGWQTATFSPAQPRDRPSAASTGSAGSAPSTGSAGSAPSTGSAASGSAASDSTADASTGSARSGSARSGSAGSGSAPAASAAAGSAGSASAATGSAATGSAACGSAADASAAFGSAADASTGSARSGSAGSGSAPVALAGSGSASTGSTGSAATGSAACGSAADGSAASGSAACGSAADASAADASTGSARSGSARPGSAGSGSAADASAGSGSASPAAGRPVSLMAIPYFAWANRQPGPMRVWLPT